MKAKVACYNYMESPVEIETKVIGLVSWYSKHSLSLRMPCSQIYLKSFLYTIVILLIILCCDSNSVKKLEQSLAKR